MPFIEIQTQSVVADPAPVLARISKLVAETLHKPESYVMASWATPAGMTFAASTEPCCAVRLQLLGTPGSEALTRLNVELCVLLHDAVGVPAERVFLIVEEVPRTHWGMGGKLFG